MDNSRISVIIPVYQVEQYLDRCLRSVADSTYRDLEIICVNDGSTDRCGEILCGYAGADARFRIITSENEGLSAARNKGLAAATGGYAAFVDSDDWVHPACFERMYRCMQENDCDAVICGYDRPEEVCAEPSLPENLPQAEIWSAEQLYRHGTKKNYVWGKLYKAELLNNARFVEERQIAEDVLFNLDVFTDHPQSRIGFLPEPLYHYYNRDDSLAYKLDYESRIRTAGHILRKSERNQEPHLRARYLTEALKSLLSVRYWSGRSHQTQTANRAGELLRQAVSSLTGLRGVSVLKKARYLVLYYVPAVYAAVQRLDELRSRRR